MANRLISETSPYLLQHAHNPVDWWPWGTAAFAEAVRRDVPVLLSVGYSACHWCHVMERESFEDPAIAAQMNRDFVCVKVDREERPEVDELYMRAVQAFNDGQGGWPMTVFLTPAGVPYFGGTYFPPAARGGMPGLPDVLAHTARLWRDQRAEVERIGDEVTKVLDRSGALPRPARLLARSWLQPIVDDAFGEWDAANGGFGGAPKFPPHGTLAVLLAHHARTGDLRSLEMATGTLDAMARGGMYDQLGGGFCRYSVDAEWRIPHFEKMLYDNGQLVPVYLDAFRITGAPHYARVVRETVGWALREMRLPEGGFAASLDADSEGGEGAFFCWRPEELAELLGDDGARAAKLLQVTAAGTFEHGTSVLRLENPIETLADADAALVRRALDALREARATRSAPARDDKVVVAWNGLMISALARAGAALGEPGWVAAAAAAADFVLDRCVVDGRLRRTFKDGRAEVPAFADDYAALALALVDLFEVTGERAWLDRAVAQADRLLALFWDEADGGLFYVGSDQPALVSRSKHPIGGAEPSANGLAALLFVRLGRLLGRDDLERKAERIARSAQSWLSNAPRALGAEALAGAWLAEGGVEVALVGDPSTAAFRSLEARFWQRALPFAVLAKVTSGTASGLPWLDGKEAVGGRATAFVCEGFTCRLPTDDPDTFAAQLDDRVRKAAAPAPPEGARVRAPELPDDPSAWIGTDVPLTLASLRGRVVILDFWTYCCINCLHVLPELKALEERYAGQPVVVIGVHCAKFPTEEVAASVRRAMQRHDVRHPVVHDPVHAIWEEYAVRSWPTVVVIDPEGRIALQQPGETTAEELGKVVDALLAEGRQRGTLADAVPVPSVTRDPGEALRFPGKVHVWPGALEQELGVDPFGGGYVYVSDTGHHRILECRLSRGPDGWPTATFVRAIGSGVAGRVDGPAEVACFREPQGCRRHEKTLYVADTGNHCLRAVDLETGVVRTLAGTGERGGGTPTREQLANPTTLALRSPWDVEVMAMRRHHLVFVAMAGSHQIWVWSEGHVGIQAGSGREDHVDGPASQAALAQPSGLVLLGRYLVFADSEISSIRAVDLQSHQVVTVVGRGLFDFGDVDGRGEKVRLQHPLGVTFVGDTLYVADTFNHKIKRIGLGSGETRTVVGGDPSVLEEPGGLARAGGFLIVADTNHHRLRVLDPRTGQLRDLPILGL